LAIALNHLQKQQQRQHLPSLECQPILPEAFKQYNVQDCLRLSSAVLHTWKFVPMLLQQRGAVLIQPSLLPKLAMALFRASAAAAASDPSSSSRVTSNSGSRLDTMSLSELAMKQAAGTESVLATALNFAVMTDTAGVRQQLQQHPEMLELLLANVAAMASQLHYQLDGKTLVQIGSQTSSSSKAGSKKGKQSSSSKSTRQQKREFASMHDRLLPLAAQTQLRFSECQKTS
jgi:hypothetical protein